MASSGDCVKNSSNALCVPHPGHSIPNHFLLGQGIIQEESSILLMSELFSVVMVSISSKRVNGAAKYPIHLKFKAFESERCSHSLLKSQFMLREIVVFICLKLHLKFFTVADYCHRN